MTSITTWDWLEQIDYDSIPVVRYTENKRQSIFKKSMTCTYCKMSYSFEYLIGKNILHKACSRHISTNYNNMYQSFSSSKKSIGPSWACCGNPPEVRGCINQCHDISTHLDLSKSTLVDFPYCVEDRAAFIHCNRIHKVVFFQMRLVIWLQIMKTFYPNKKNIPINSIPLIDVLFFANRTKYLEYINQFKSEPIVIDDDESDNNNKSETSENILEYAIIRYNMYECFL